jgi:hypothetical protein
MLSTWLLAFLRVGRVTGRLRTERSLSVQNLDLCSLEFLVGDRPPVVQLHEFHEFICFAALSAACAGGRLTDVGVEFLLPCPGMASLAFTHALAPGDDVDENADEGKDDQCVFPLHAGRDPSL